MTNQKLTKLICFGLVAIMSVTAFASCTDSGSGKEKETDSSVTTSAKDEEQSDADALVESLYGDRNYNGQKVRILALPAGSTWYTSISDTANEVWFEDAGSDVLQKSVYERNRKTQELINVEITPVWGESSGQILERINQDVNAGVDDYDAAFLSISTAMTAAQNGNTLNFNDVSSFDASHEWWNQRLLEDCTFFGEDVYAVAGALNIWDDCATNVLLFNKNLLEKNNCTVPYQEVFDGTWTVDALMTRAKAVTQDLNGDTDYDENDSWGIGTYESGIVAALEGFDSGIARMGSEGTP